MLSFAQPLGILAVNAIPLLGVLWFGWSVFEVVMLFWFENVAIGVTHTLRMAICARTNNIKDGRATALFFAMHYGIFTFVHGIFVIVIFGIVAGGLANYRGGLLGPIAAIMFWQFVALGIDHLQTAGFKGQHTDNLMFQPYPRVFALHITVIAAGWLISEMGSPVWLLAMLVGLKTAFDLSLLRLAPRGNPAAAFASLRQEGDQPPH